MAFFEKIKANDLLYNDLFLVKNIDNNQCVQRDIYKYYLIITPSSYK